MPDTFKLTLLLPDRVLLTADATRLGGEATNGSFVILPRHADFVTPLVPGILYFQADPDTVDMPAADTPATGDITYVANDSGILVKRAADVWVSVLQAIPGEDLEHLEQVVDEDYRQLDQRQKETQTALARLETSFMRGLIDLGRSSP